MSRLGSRVVLCHGVWDLVHLGHVHHLEEARRQGDALVVSVTPDEHAAKAPDRPVYPQAMRAEMLASLACVDAVILSEGATAVKAIEAVRPAVYCKGKEYAHGELSQLEIEAAERVGARVHFTDGPVQSSSALINRHLDVMAPEVREYLTRAREKGFAARIPVLIESIADMKVLFAGETIIDEYVYVSGLGKPSKENILAVHSQDREIFTGGVVAASNHARSFVAQADVISARTITKRRYVDRNGTRKLFEVYEGELGPITEAEEIETIREIEAKAPQADLVVVVDFGHGMMTPNVVESLIANSRWLAVNTQTNSANHGFNTLRKYHSADYACVDLPEARLALDAPHIDATEAVFRLSGETILDVIVTDGTRGCVVGHRMRRIPAFSTRSVDTMGAGDAFLAVTAPLAKMSSPDLEIVGFVGNIVGALKCQVIGHRASVNKVTVLRYCATLLK